MPLNSFAGFSISQDTATTGEIFANSQSQLVNYQLNWDSGISGSETNIIDMPNGSINSYTTISFAIFFKNISLINKHTNIFDIYKQTLGQGLGLP